MSTFTWIPTDSSSVGYAPKVRKAQFGDGYAQRTPNGINNNPESWNLTFTNLTTSEYDAIMDFLNARNATQAFDWTGETGVKKMYICETWEGRRNQEDNYTITAKFVQFFG